jgi:hypothetical protein
MDAGGRDHCWAQGGSRSYGGGQLGDRATDRCYIMGALTAAAGWLLTKIGETVVQSATQHALQKFGLFSATCQTCRNLKPQVSIAENSPTRLTCERCGHTGTILVENVASLVVHEVHHANIFVQSAQVHLASTMPASAPLSGDPHCVDYEDKWTEMQAIVARSAELQRQGEYRAAVDEYRKIIDYEPTDPGKCHNLGCMCEQFGFAPEAELWYRRSVELGDFGSAENLGYLLYRQGRSTEALHFLLLVEHPSDFQSEMIAHLRQLLRL